MNQLMKSKTDFFIGPAIGGEYMFNKHFSLGGEINLNYISIGHYDSEGECFKLGYFNQRSDLFDAGM